MNVLGYQGVAVVEQVYTILFLLLLLIAFKYIFSCKYNFLLRNNFVPWLCLDRCRLYTCTAWMANEHQHPPTHTIGRTGDPLFVVTKAQPTCFYGVFCSVVQLRVPRWGKWWTATALHKIIIYDKNITHHMIAEHDKLIFVVSWFTLPMRWVSGSQCIFVVVAFFALHRHILHVKYFIKQKTNCDCGHN